MSRRTNLEEEDSNSILSHVRVEEVTQEKKKNTQKYIYRCIHKCAVCVCVCEEKYVKKKRLIKVLFVTAHSFKLCFSFWEFCCFLR